MFYLQLKHCKHVPTGLVWHPLLSYTTSFNIRNYVGFCQLPTRSSASQCNKLQHVFSSTNKKSNFYFNRLPRISLPALDLSQPFTRIKSYHKNFFWNQFTKNSILMILILLISFAHVPSAQSIHVHVHPISALFVYN